MGRQGTSRGDVSRRLGACTRAHRQRRRWLAGLVVAAAAVVLCTVCALTVPASTLTWDQVDGGEEQAETTEEAAVQTASATEDETSAGVATTLPDGASVPEGYTQTFTYEDTDKGYAVSAYAAEGVVPEGATLKASLLSEDEDAYAAAEEALAADAGEESDYGFAALDIRFEDAEGNEVEPSGDVYVVINADGLLPDDTDPSTVTVQHLAEDESGGVASVDAVADVADATDGVVNVSDDTNVQAAFSVDSFSTFTITWNSYFRVTVYYVDENGNGIQGAQTQAVSISNGQTVTFSNYAEDISGYTYSDAHFNSYNGNTVTRMSASQQSSGRPGNTTRTLTFYNGNNVVDTLTYSNRTQTADVYLVYECSSYSTNSITFKYYSLNEIDDEEAISDRSSIKYTIVLLDEDGVTESYNLPEGSSVPDTFTFNADTVEMTASSFAQMGITIPGYTFEDGYAYFYWTGNFLGDKYRVLNFRNFGEMSDGHQNYLSYIGFEALYPDSSSGTGYTDSSAGVDYTTTWGDDGAGYYAYNPTGTLRIVFQKVNETVTYHANFVDAYQVSNYRQIDATEMNMAQDVDGTWYGTLAKITDVEPTKSGYKFVGWYDDVDENGNGTGKRISSIDDDTTAYYQDAYYYARWELDLDVEVNPEVPAVSKYVDDNENGTYDLSLSATGTTVKETKKLNILYILDESYSMMWTMDGNYPSDGKNTSGDSQYDSDGEAYEYSFERYKAALNAITLMNDTLESSTALDVQYALVGFASEASIASYWTSGSVSLPNVEWASFASGTNYADAFEKARALLDSARSGAETVVVFITDGEPNRPSSTTATSAAAAALQKLSGGRFYAVGVGSEIGNAYLEELVDSNAIGFETTGTFQSGDATEIAQYFAQLAADLTGSVTKNATIVDELSEYAQLVSTSASPKITITDADGNPVNVTSNNDGHTDENGVYTETFTFSDFTAYGSTSATVQNLTYTYYPANTYDSDGDGSADNEYPVITLEFPDTYELTQDWTYTITVQIEPTDAAYGYTSTEEDTSERDGYPHVGDSDTDAKGNETSSEKPGFHSNTEASLTYEDGEGESREESYPHPVIQVRTADLSFKKVDSTNVNTALSGAKFVLYKIETVPVVDGEEGETREVKYYYTETTDNETGLASVSWDPDLSNAFSFTSAEDGTFTLENLVIGQTYYLSEIQAPDGYQLLANDIQITWIGNSPSITTGITQVTDSDSDGKYEIANTTGIELPDTGGSGTTWFTFGGAALIAAAACGYGLKSSRERRDASC